MRRYAIACAAARRDHGLHDALKSRLRNAGYRVTRQRVAIYEYLRSTDSHPTAEQVVGAVRGRLPRVSLATVYNGIDSLVSIGLVRRIARGASPARYDAGTDEHAHFRCSACDEIRDVPMPSLPAIPADVDVGEVAGVNVEYAGVCPRCRRRKLGLPDAAHVESSPSTGE